MTKAYFTAKVLPEILSDKFFIADHKTPLTKHTETYSQYAKRVGNLNAAIKYYASYGNSALGSLDERITTTNQFKGKLTHMYNHMFKEYFTAKVLPEILSDKFFIADHKSRLCRHRNIDPILQEKFASGPGML